MVAQQQIQATLRHYGPNWKELDKHVLVAMCQRLGQNARGTREEVIRRIERAVENPYTLRGRWQVLK